MCLRPHLEQDPCGDRRYTYVGAACGTDPTVTVLAVDDGDGEVPLEVHVETRLVGPERCGACGTTAWIKDRPRLVLVDLPAFGRRVRLVWHKRRWCCPQAGCPTGSWTEQVAAIAASRLVLTDRAGRWVTVQVGGHW